MTGLTIGDIAKQAGIETSTIRYYERIGLLPRPKRVNGRRVYDEDVLKRLVLIRGTKAAGFTIAEIQTLMTNWVAEGRIPTEWRQFVERKLNEVDTLIAEAQRTRKLLNAALDCGCWDDYNIPFDSYVAATSIEQTNDRTER